MVAWHCGWVALRCTTGWLGWCLRVASTGRARIGAAFCVAAAADGARTMPCCALQGPKVLTGLATASTLDGYNTGA